MSLAIATLVCVPTAEAANGGVSQLTLDAYGPSTKANTPPVATAHKLPRDKLYVATVQGTISFYAAIDYVAVQLPFKRVCGTPQSAPSFTSAGGVGHVSNDAQFVFALPTTGKSCAHTVLPRPWPNFQVNLGRRWAHPALLSAHPLTKPSSTHTYEYALAGDDRAAKFRVLDSDVRDNYGSFLITIRAAVKGDCAGSKYRAFGVTTRAACSKATAGAPAAPPVPPAPAPLTLDQTPIARVLRDSDIPGAMNLEAPSGALTASQLAALDNSGGSQAADELNVLNADGYVSGAITEMTAHGVPLLRQAVAEFGSSAEALAAEHAEVGLASADQAPKGTSATAGVDPALGESSVVTFTPTAAGGAGGLELFAVQGNYLYTLKAVEQPDHVSQTVEDHLLGTIIARG